MATQPKRKLAVVLHADVVGSTELARRDELLAHTRVQEAFRRFSSVIQAYQGTTHELRGDALIAEFNRASDAVCAAIAFQATNRDVNARLKDGIRPQVRIGIALGEVIIADGTITGAGIVLAQRVEQLAKPNGVCVTAAIHEAAPERLPFEFSALGKQSLKGFSAATEVLSVALASGERVPDPEPRSAAPTALAGMARRVAAAVALVMVTAIVAISWWLKPSEPPDGSVIEHSNKPSIAVLAFENRSGDPTQDYLSDGISDSLITGLSRFPNLHVIARQSSFSYRDSRAKAQQIGEELGAHYLLDGSVHRASDRIRVNANLIDAATGRHLWAEKYDRRWQDIFALQDDITQHILANISSFEGPLEEASRGRAKRKPPSDLKAYDYLLLARARFFLVTKEHNAKARKLLADAVSLDPNYSLGHAWLAWTHSIDFSFGWSDEPERSLQTALAHATRAVELDDAESDARWALGNIYSKLGRPPETVQMEYEQALSLNPNNADLIAEYGWTLPKLGLAEKGVEYVRHAMRLNPLHPDWYVQALMFALYNAKRYQEVIALAGRANVRHLTTHLVLAGAFAQLDRHEDAKRSAAAALELKPGFSLAWWARRQNFANPLDLDHYLNGLRKAGLPE